MQSMPRTPIKFTQPDTENLAYEITRLRELHFPLSQVDRPNAVSELEAFAVEWSVKFPKELSIDNLYDYEICFAVFGRTKGEIMKKMKPELTKMSKRDSDAMEKILGGAIDFGEVGGEPPD
jgi:hypothetical protein